MTINLTSARLRAVIYYELLMLWRQRVIPVAMIVLTLTLLLLDGAVGNNITTPPPNAALLVQTFSAILPVSLMYLYIVALVVPPILVADAIPRDRQYRIRELWRTLPLTDSVYLVGKVLASSIAIGFGTCIATFVGGLGYTILVHPLYMGTYLDATLFGVLPVVTTVPGLAVLLASGQPTRRRAILMGVAISTGSLLLLAFLTPSAADPINYLNPTRPIVFLAYLYQLATLAPNGNQAFAAVTDAQLTLAALIGFMELAVATALTTAAFRRAQAH